MDEEEEEEEVENEVVEVEDEESDREDNEKVARNSDELTIEQLMVKPSKKAPIVRPILVLF